MLERALELAERGRGTTRPNPIVGAVVVRDGEVVGEGWHERAGLPHAEVNALAAAGNRARGATMYVSLEPCSHHGRTAPCVDAVLAAGVARVVVGAEDPNPEVSGLERLREAGVEVELADSFEARRQNEAWRTWIALRRPFVTYKVAVTLDGRVAVPDARWVTGEASRRLAAVGVEERRGLLLQPDRAPVIVAGAVLVLELLRFFDLPALEVTERDLLHGAALEAAALPEPEEGEAPPGAYTCC